MGADPPADRAESGAPPASGAGAHAGAEVRQEVTAARDAYIAGRDAYVINLGQQSEASGGAPPGRLIGELDERDALALEVHQAFEVSTASASGRVPILPAYLPRPGFDDRLRAAVADAAHGSRMVLVVGDSSTGKTRACWEAIRAELPDWRVWHPLTPERPAALAEAVRAGRVAPHTVIWLNEAQFYLQPGGGERVAAELQALLADPERGPILVLGSMWPGFQTALTAVPDAPAGPDGHRAARALLGRVEYVTAPPKFTAAQLTDLAAAIAADPRLAAASTRAPGGRITQELAGAPELLRRYEQAGPAGRAVLWAAMDARRLGRSLLLPEPLLRDAAPGYLDDHEWDEVGGTDWFAAAMDELTVPHRRLPGPLIEHRPRPGAPRPPHRLYRLADFLDQHARIERNLSRPPAAFWDAAARHAHTPRDLVELGGQAASRGRYRHAANLYQAAIDAGHLLALLDLARLREKVGDWDGARRLYEQAADSRDPVVLRSMDSWLIEPGERLYSEVLYPEAADAGDPDALLELARLRKQVGELEDAERLARQAADAGNPDALLYLAQLQEWAGNQQDAERLARQAADAGSRHAPQYLAGLRDQAEEQQDADRDLRTALRRANAGKRRTADPERLDGLLRSALWEGKIGDPRDAERLAVQLTQAGYTSSLVFLAGLREQGGDQPTAERLYRPAADAGDLRALRRLVELRLSAGDIQDAKRLARQAADAGDSYALLDVARVREGKARTRLRARNRSWQEAADKLRPIAERLYQRAADAGNPDALMRLSELREEVGDRQGAERLAFRAAEAGHHDALTPLVELWDRTGDRQDAERLALHTAALGDPVPLLRLAELREERYRIPLWMGDQDQPRQEAPDQLLRDAERLALQAADAGHFRALSYLVELRMRSDDPESAERLRSYGLTAAGEVEEPWRGIPS